MPEEHKSEKEQEAQPVDSPPVNTPPTDLALYLLGGEVKVEARIAEILRSLTEHSRVKDTTIYAPMEDIGSWSGHHWYFPEINHFRHVNVESVWNSAENHKKRRAEENMAAVVKTIWILWENDLDTIWQILRHWSIDGEILSAASHRILLTGLEQGHLTVEQTFHSITVWLSHENKDYQRAGAELLTVLIPIIHPEKLFDLAVRWADLGDAEQLSALPKLMARLFSLYPHRTLNIFVHWTKQYPAKFDKAIADALRRSEAPRDEAKGFYTTLEKQLILYGASVTNGPIKRSVREMLNLVRAQMSKPPERNNNWKKSQDGWRSKKGRR